MWSMNCNRLINLRNLLFFLVICLTACSSESSLYADNQSHPQIIKKIESFYQVWKKTPYRYGGNNSKGIDCSGLTKTFYHQKLGKVLPRVTKEQIIEGKAVKQLSAGDLVFFKSGRGTTGLHVGIYYKNGLFLHASTKNGVQYSNLNDHYWRNHYLSARRIVD